MKLNEKLINIVVLFIVLSCSLAYIIYYISKGYTSFGIHFIPSIFIVVSLIGLFKNYFSKLLTPVFLKIDGLKIINFFLILFLLVGLSLTYFLISIGVTHVGGYVVSISFIILPAFLLYAFKYGVPVSEKYLKQQEDNRQVMTFDDEGIAVTMPIFDKVCYIKWNTIETIMYTNYREDEYSYYTFYLLTVPTYIKNEKQWWLNKLFSKDSTRKKIRINSDCKNIFSLPEIAMKYLGKINKLDLTDSRKGTLISSKTTITSNNKTITEKWKPNNNYEPIQIIFDINNRTISDFFSERSDTIN